MGCVGHDPRLSVPVCHEPRSWARPEWGTWATTPVYRCLCATSPVRYVWPSELDLMARLAGLRLRDRWAGWNREPFTTDSRSHVSVWEKPVQHPDA
jgi:hypothetical protein